uniref:Chitin-binding type-2 domain-containing protein n=1 Tax=Trichuris muris TaxID=70415 RepID=A0A5S6QZQ3_TRIMR
MVALLLLLGIAKAFSLASDWLPANTICLRNPDGDYELTPCSSIYVRCVNHRTFLMKCDLATWVFSKAYRSCKPPLLLDQCKSSPPSYFEGTFCREKMDGVYASGPCSTSYVICFGQQSYSARCEHSKVFSALEQACVGQESLPECKQQFHSWTFHDLCANQFPNGADLPLAACSSEYISCRQAIPTFANCTAGQSFKVGVGCVPTWQNPFCQQRSQTAALHNLAIASQFCVHKPDGIYVPQASICSSEAIVCNRNKANLLRCPDKHYYSASARNCLPADMRWCKYVGTAEQHDLGYQLIQYSCAKFGHRFHGPDKCSTWYLHCYPGKQSMLHCVQGTVYDQATDTCVTQSACNPWNANFCSMKEGNDVGQLRPCSETYLICYDGRTFIMTCPNGLVFSSEVKACVERMLCNQSLASKPVTTCSPTGNHYIPIAPCTQQYLRCWDGHLLTLYCADGLVFEPNLQTCIEPSSSAFCAQYDNNPCKNKADGSYGITRCSATYLRCDRSQSSWSYCSPGDVFDSNSGTCVPARFQACTPEQRTACHGQTDGPIQPWACKDTLIVCVNGDATPKPCPTPLPMRMERCLSSACQGSNNPCSPWSNDQRALEPCSGTYVVCLYGYPYTQVCPEGKVFLNESRSCVPKSENRFCSTNSLCSPYANELKALESCSGTYIACLNGKPYTQTCPNGQVFYNVSNSCVSKSTNQFCYGNSFCSPMVNEKKALAPCSGTYIECLNGRPFTQTCPNGQIFFNETSSCTAKQNNRYCSNVQHDCTVEGEFIADPNDCTVFYRCTHGRRIKFTCPPGTGFNPQINVCDWKSNIPSCKGS